MKPVNLTDEEWKSFTEEMTALLEKYDIEMGVIASLSFTSREPELVESPYKDDESNQEIKT